jgi:hypothetical protein
MKTIILAMTLLITSQFAFAQVDLTKDSQFTCVVTQYLHRMNEAEFAKNKLRAEREKELHPGRNAELGLTILDLSEDMFKAEQAWRLFVNDLQFMETTQDWQVGFKYQADRLNEERLLFGISQACH